MYGIFTYISHTNQPNVGKYNMRGWYGLYFLVSRSGDLPLAQPKHAEVLHRSAQSCAHIPDLQIQTSSERMLQKQVIQS